MSPPPRLAALLLTCLASAPLAQTLVTAPRAGRAASASPATLVLSGDDLVRSGARSLPQAIARAGGLLVQETNLGGGAPYLRGLIGNQVLILVDGVRLNDATTRSGPNQSLNAIDPAIVARVDVIRGPTSVLYGSDAVGGVVAIWTKRATPTALDPEALPGLDGGVDALYHSAVRGGRLSATSSVALERDGVLLVASAFDFDDLQTGAGTAELTGYDGGAVFGTWTHALDRDRRLEATARINRNEDVPRTDRLVPGFGQLTPSNAEFTFLREQREGYLLAYTDERGASFFDRMQARLSFRRTVEERAERSFGSSTRSLERDEIETAGLGLDWQKALGESHLLTFGFDVDSDEVDSSDVNTSLTSGTQTAVDGEFAPGARYTSLGVFARDEIFACAPLDVSLGVRYSLYSYSFDAFPSAPLGESEDGTFDALTASLQVARPLGGGVRASATLAQGFRAPNLDELARNGSFFGGQELANPDLDPEQSTTAEVALDVARESFSGYVALYLTRIEDLVGRTLVDPGSSGNGVFLRENSGRARIHGAEVGVEGRLGPERSPLRYEAALAFARGRQFDGTTDPATGDKPLDGVDFRRIPPLFGRAALVFAPAERARLDRAELELVFADDQDELHPEDLLDARIDPDGTPGFGLLNVGVEGRLGGCGSRSRWSVGLQNVLDKHYRVHGSGIDGPGRSLVVGLSLYP